MAQHEHQNALQHLEPVEDDLPSAKLKSNYLVSKDRRKMQDGVETAEQLLALEIQFTKTLPGQWVMNLKILGKDETQKPKILESAVFKISESDQYYDRLSNKPMVDESCTNIVNFRLDAIDKSPLCLAIFFKGSDLLAFELSFTRTRKPGDFTSVPVSSMHHLAPPEISSDQTPFSWAFARRWFEPFSSSDDETVLLWAATKGSLELMEHLQAHTTDRFRTLLEHGNNDKRTPLSLAAGACRKEIVKFLVDTGARIDSLDEYRRTPLSWAASQPDSSDQYDLLRFLAEHCKASGSLPSWWVLRHFHQAARFGWTNAILPLSMSLSSYLLTDIDTLLPCDAVQSLGDEIYHDKSALCISAEFGHIDTVRKLLNWGANANFVTPGSGNSPLMLAISGAADEYHKEAVVDVLLSGGAEVSRRNWNGETANNLAMRMKLQGVTTKLAWGSKDGPVSETVGHLDQEVDSLFLATITNFDAQRSSFKRQECTVSTLLQELEDGPNEAKEDAGVGFRWIHLPANNMRWIEVLFSQLYKNQAQTYSILKPERWVRQQHYRGLDTWDTNKPGVHHARFMRPMCEAFRSSSDLSSNSESLDVEEDDCDTSLVLFMPYLHWDITSQQTRRERVMEQPMHYIRTSDQWDNEQKFLNAYLRFREDSDYYQHGMHQAHVRRTLDQYYYHGLEDTRERDHDQVLSRAVCQRHLPPQSKVLAMVDQLWLWCLAARHDQPTTIVTCFPNREPQPIGRFSGDRNTSKASAGDPDPYGDTNILNQIFWHMLDYPRSVETPPDLIRLITLKCSRTYMDIGEQDERLRFKEMYQMAIGDVMQQEIERLNEFTAILQATKQDRIKNKSLKLELKALSDLVNSEASRHTQQFQAELAETFEAVFNDLNDTSANRLINSIVQASGDKITQEKAETLLKLAQLQVVDITKEVQLLYEIKDVQDELRIMSMIFKDQYALIPNMEKTLESISFEITSQKRKLEESADVERTPQGYFDEKQRDILSPHAIIELSINEIEDMIDRANNTYNALSVLIDLKQKQSNVMDSRYARIQAEESVKQGKTIMVFTIVTIIFLPLSFMAAFFAIDISQFNRLKDGRLSLGYISEIMFPISAVIIAVLIGIAFNVDSLERLWAIIVPRWEKKKVVVDVDERLDV